MYVLESDNTTGTDDVETDNGDSSIRSFINSNTKQDFVFWNTQ